jgi:uncharacterized protein YrrD
MERPNSTELLRSALINRLAIDLQTAEELGRVTQVLVDVRSQRVAGLVCGGGVLQRGGQTFLWDQVNSVGHHGVVIRAGVPLPEGKQVLAEALPLAELELWSDNGDRVGLLSDFGFEPHSGQILHYRFIADATSGFEPGLYQFSPNAVVSTGRRRMMAYDQALGQATLLKAGVQAPPPHHRREVFGYDIPDPRQGWETAVEGTREARQQVREQFSGQFQEVSGQLQERGEKLRSEAQEKLGGLLGNVKKRTRRLRNQMRETVTDLTAGLPASRRLEDDDIETIEVDSTELWSREDHSQP